MTFGQLILKKLHFYESMYMCECVCVCVGVFVCVYMCVYVCVCVCDQQRYSHSKPYRTCLSIIMPEQMIIIFTYDLIHVIDILDHRAWVVHELR